MAWTIEQAYPIFLDVVLCVNLTTILFYLFCMYVCMYVFSCVQMNYDSIRKGGCPITEKS